MYGEQCNHARQHEHLRQQSTTLLVTLASGAAVVEASLLGSALSQTGSAMLWLVVASYSLIGLVVIVLALHGRKLSLKHWHRNTQHRERATAFRNLLETHFPIEVHLTELRLRQMNDEGPVKESVHELWANIYVFLVVLGLVLVVVPLGLATWLATTPPQP
jgi:hypothetical protein